MRQKRHPTWRKPAGMANLKLQRALPRLWRTTDGKLPRNHQKRTLRPQSGILNAPAVR